VELYLHSPIRLRAVVLSEAQGQLYLYLFCFNTQFFLLYLFCLHSYTSVSIYSDSPIYTSYSSLASMIYSSPSAYLSIILFFLISPPLHFVLLLIDLILFLSLYVCFYKFRSLCLKFL